MCVDHPTHTLAVYEIFDIFHTISLSLSLSFHTHTHVQFIDVIKKSPYSILLGKYDDMRMARNWYKRTSGFLGLNLFLEKKI